MTLSPQHLKVLRMIAHSLETTTIKWAVTGSCSLALQGLPVAVGDIDLRTDAPGAYAIEALFQPYRTQPVRFLTSDRIRSHLGVLAISDIQVEIIGDMIYRLADGSWSSPVDLDSVKRSVEPLQVPVISLESLRDSYRLLDRPEKVALIEEWLRIGG